jgi:hypothetical protein
MIKILSWLSYIAFGLWVQQEAISRMCQIRGSQEIGGEYLILIGMIVLRIFLGQVINDIRGYEEE